MMAAGQNENANCLEITAAEKIKCHYSHLGSLFKKKKKKSYRTDFKMFEHLISTRAATNDYFYID